MVPNTAARTTDFILNLYGYLIIDLSVRSAVWECWGRKKSRFSQAPRCAPPKLPFAAFEMQLFNKLFASQPSKLPRRRGLAASYPVVCHRLTSTKTASAVFFFLLLYPLKFYRTAALVSCSSFPSRE